MMKTDLKRILSISGEQGLFSYVSQATAGVIAESMLTGRRNCFGIRSRMTSLHDISIYTSEGEIRLQEVFEKMHAYLNDNAAPSQKSSPEELKKFFSKAVPEYDRDRFYVSHMKKVVEWYNILREHASLDFANDDDNNATDGQTEE